MKRMLTEHALTEVIILNYRKIPKIIPSMYKPPKITGPNISPPGACTRKIVFKYKLKQSKNGKFNSNYKASPIDLEAQISLPR